MDNVPRKHGPSTQGWGFLFASIVLPALVKTCFCQSWIPYVRAMIAVVVFVLLVISIQYWHWILLLPS
jgi:hypothetical protein